MNCPKCKKEIKKTDPMCSVGLGKKTLYFHTECYRKIREEAFGKYAKNK